MLPGFRFLFAAILLSTSFLVFGLGAAALLRAAHEEFASNPSWRTGPQEQVFARQEPREAVLATLQIEPPATEPKTPEQVIPAAPPEAVAPAAKEPEQAVVVPPETTVQPESPNVEVAAVQPTIGLPQQLDITPPAPEAAAPAIAPEPAETPAGEATLDAVQEALAAVLVGVPAASTAAPEEKKQDADGVPPSNTDSAATKTAALGDAAVTISQEPQAQEKSAVKPRVHRARKRHRVAQRPPAPAPVQPIFNPFAPQPMQPVARPNQIHSQPAR